MISSMLSCVPSTYKQWEFNDTPMNKVYPCCVKATFILEQPNGKLSYEELASSKIMMAFGSCFVWAILCPCLNPKKKEEKKNSSSREMTSTSMSTSLGECSTVGSFSVNSGLSQPLQKLNQGRTFTLAELKKATSNFSPTYKIGQGSHGVVYKGKLKDGSVVAIKRARKVLSDSRISTEFKNEVNILLNIEHLNLVKLIGYLEENNEWFLVTEYIASGNLREHLDCVHGVIIDLSTRLDICIDVAHSLTYLHLYADKPIIHRDIKSTNILLTETFRAKVADFGYSRVGPLELGATHVSTQVKGTAGYLDPEYLKTFQLTEKSDVYSFGVLLAEIITGRRPIEQEKEMRERITLRWVFKKVLDGNVSDILDPRLKGTPSAYRVVERLSELAFQCSAPSKHDRPNMKRVAEILWDIRKDHSNMLQDMASEATGSECLAAEDSSKEILGSSRSRKA